MTRFGKLLGLLLLLSLALPARGDETPKAPDLTKYRQFAQRVQKVVNENKTDAFAACFNQDALVERTVRDLRLPKGMLKSLIEAVKKEKVAGQLAGQVCKAVHDEGSYVLLRVRTVEGQPRALFRFLSSRGLNYHDLLLAKDEAGEIRIVDMYVAITAEFVSESMRRMACLMISGDPKQSERLDASNDFIKNHEKIERFLNNARAGHCREALQEWDRLPASVKKEKLMLLMHVMSRAGLMDEDEAAYQKAMEDFRKAFPNDPSVDLISLDQMFLKKRFRTFQRGVDRIEQAYGRDPYLDVLRTSGYLEEQKWDEARKCIRRAIQDEPSLQPAYWAALRVSLRSKDFKDTARMLGELENRFKVKFGDLGEEEEFKDFVKSPEYREWQKPRKKF